MLWRKRQQDIIEWINNGTKALLVTGARQIGKTYLIEQTLKEKGVDYVSFNLIRQPEVKQLFDISNNSDITVFLERLTLLTNHPLTKGKTIILITHN